MRKETSKEKFIRRMQNTMHSVKPWYSATVVCIAGVANLPGDQQCVAVLTTERRAIAKMCGIYTHEAAFRD